MLLQNNLLKDSLMRCHLFVMIDFLAFILIFKYFLFRYYYHFTYLCNNKLYVLW